MNNGVFNRIISYFFLAVLSALVYFIVGDTKDLFKHYKTDQNTINEINKIQIDKAALDSNLIPSKFEYELINESLIESDTKIFNLKSEINILKSKIIEANKKGFDISSEIINLKQKENELKTYLIIKKRQIDVLKDTVLTYSQRLSRFDRELYSKKANLDSLEKYYNQLSVNCN